MQAVERVKVDLRELEKNRQAVDGLQVQIEEVEADMLHDSEMGFLTTDKGPVPSEARMKALVDQKRALTKRMKAKYDHVAHVDRVLASLGEQERDILLSFYCKGLKPGAACVRLQHRWNISRSEVYRQRDLLLADCAARMGYE